MNNKTNGLVEQILELDTLLRQYMHSTHRRGHGRNEQGRALALLALQPQSSVRELAYLMGLPMQVVQELAGELEALGYVVLNDGQEFLQVTSEGKAALRSDALDDRDTLFGCLEEAEREALSDYLDRLTDAVKEKLEDLPAGEGRDERAAWMCGTHGLWGGMPGAAGGCGHHGGRPDGRMDRRGMQDLRGYGMRRPEGWDPRMGGCEAAAE